MVIDAHFLETLVLFHFTTVDGMCILLSRDMLNHLTLREKSRSWCWSRQKVSFTSPRYTAAVLQIDVRSFDYTDHHFELGR